MSVFFFNLDGTLVNSPSEEKMVDSARIAIQLLKSKGHTCMIATGRTYYHSLPYMEMMDGIVYSDGAGIVLKNGYQSTNGIPKESLENLLKQVFSLHGEVRINTKNASYFSKESYASLLKMAREYNMALDEVYPLTAYQEEEALEVDVFVQDEKTEEMLMQQLDRSLQYISTSETDRHHDGSSGEITIRNVSKASGIRQIMQMLDVDMNDVYAFGDSMNDLQMIQMVGHGIVMGNGVAQLKEVAQMVCPPVMEDGIAYACMKLGLFTEEEFLQKKREL